APDNSDGILNSPVTWADFENNLRKALGTDAKLGANKAVFDIGDGNGFATLCGLITCDWIEASEDEKLPKKVILKIPSILPIKKLNDSLPDDHKMFNFGEEQWIAMEAEMIQIHNTEVVSYEFTEEFEGLTMPKKYYSILAEPGTSGQLCLEYKENTRTMNFYEKHSVEQLRQIARALGKVQACSLKKEPTNPQLNNDLFSKMDEMWPLETFRGMFKGLATIDNSEKTLALLEKVDVLVEKYYASNLAISIPKQMGFRPVLVNGDMHTGNVLIDSNSGDLVSLIDWQLTHIGVGVEDLHRIAMSALMTEERRASMPILIEVMYESLVENLDGTEPPYTLEKLHLISDLIFPQCSIFLTCAFLAFISKIMKDPKLTDEEKSERKDVMLDKVIGALEDLVEIDEKNKKHMEDLNLKLKLKA
ncbi:hypothetical protein PMAYCL1PPCAC_11491, partial [Pristionchus mayeri]